MLSKVELLNKNWLKAMIFVWGISMLTYGLTVSKYHMNYADSDDLVLAAKTGGIAHPPGYPVYTGLLKIFLSLPISENIAWKVNWSSAFWQSLSLVGLYFVGYHLLGTKIKKGKWLVAGTGALFTGFTYSLWFHANVVEVFAFNQFLAIWYIYLILRLYTVKDKLGYWGGGTAILLGVGLAHHQSFVFLTPFLVLVLSKINKWKFSWVLLLLIGLGFVFSYSLLWIYDSGKADYSWTFDGSWKGLWEMVMREIYTNEGSAVELDAYRWEPRRSLLALGQYFWWLAKEYVIVGLGLAFIGWWNWFKDKKKVSLIWLVAWFLSGPGLAMLMKFPEVTGNSDQGYFWGWALRERMLLLSEFLIGIPLILGISVLYKYFENKRKAGVFKLSMVVILGGMMLVNFRLVDMRDSNFTYYFSRDVLDSLPEKSVLIVDSDAVFGLLYEQLVNSYRTDLEVIPVTVQMRSSYYLDEGKDFLGMSQFYSTRSRQLSELVAWNLSKGRRVFLFDVEAKGLEYLGLEGNPFYGKPNGYVIEVRKEPFFQVDSYDYGLTVQLSEIVDEQNFTDWDLGWMGNLAKIHTMLGYYYGRSGFMQGAEKHIQIASELVRLKHNKSEIFRTYGYLNERERESINLIKPLSSDEWYKKGIDSWEKGKVVDAIWNLQRSILKNPKNILAREKLVELYLSNGMMEEAKEERDIINRGITLVN